jgi:hypothetical protein
LNIEHAVGATAGQVHQQQGRYISWIGSRSMTGSSVGASVLCAGDGELGRLAGLWAVGVGTHEKGSSSSSSSSMSSQWWASLCWGSAAEGGRGGKRG